MYHSQFYILTLLTFFTIVSLKSIKKISHITQHKIFLNLSPISISLNSKNNFIFYFMVSDIYYFYAI